MSVKNVAAQIELASRDHKITSEEGRGIVEAAGHNTDVEEGGLLDALRADIDAGQIDADKFVSESLTAAQQRMPVKVLERGKQAAVIALSAPFALLTAAIGANDSGHKGGALEVGGAALVGLALLPVGVAVSPIAAAVGVVSGLVQKYRD